ncbi:MAG: Spy/CpxP family protein refolding chaperone, partial [Bryobacteraceae bacterium]
GESTMRRNLIGLAMVAALAAGAVIAQTGTGKLALGAGLRQRIIKNLNLSADQKTQAKAIFQAAKQAGAPIRTQLQANRQAMVAAIKAGDAAQIQSLATAGGALQGQLMANRASAMAKLYAMLTPDQQTKLDQMQAKIQQLVQQLRGDGQTGN